MSWSLSAFVLIGCFFLLSFFQPKCFKVLLLPSICSWCRRFVFWCIGEDFLRSALHPWWDPLPWKCPIRCEISCICSTFIFFHQPYWKMECAFLMNFHNFRASRSILALRILPHGLKKSKGSLDFLMGSLLALLCMEMLLLRLRIL